MNQDVTEVRRAALRVARWLIEKEQPHNAVRVLSAWAAQGPNDGQARELLAEALRIDPAALEAQQAFELMEGMRAPRPELDQALAEFGAEQIIRLDQGVRAPTFRKAQIGFNNNVRTKDQVFHVQTEDSGLDAPHVITHLFADGGRVIKSYKRSYKAAIATEADIGAYVKKLMKAQHLEIVMRLREGAFDAILAGKAVGGMELREDYPDVDLSRLKNRGKTSGQHAEVAPAEAPRAEAEPPPAPVAAAPAPPAPAAVPVPPPLPRAAAASQPRATEAPARAKVLYTMHVLRSLGGGPDRYTVTRKETVMGKNGEIALVGERFCHPREAVLAIKDGRLWIEDVPGGNGVFLRIHQPIALSYHDEFIVGDQLLVVQENPVSDDEPDPAPTYFYSSPRWHSAFRVVQIFAGGAPGACVVARGNTLQIGAAVGDFILCDDPLVDPQHCVIEDQAGTLVLTDLGSRNGVFVRVQGVQELINGDELVVGRTHLVVAVPPESLAG
jgi:hypothetical protein